MRSGQKNTAVIDAGTAVRGSLEGSEDLHVEGRFEGQLRLTEALFVGPSAIVEASIVRNLTPVTLRATRS